MPTGKAFIVERFGYFNKILSSGINIINPFAEKVVAIVDLTDQVMNINNQSITLKNWETVKVNTKIVYVIINPQKIYYQYVNFKQDFYQKAKRIIEEVLIESNADNCSDILVKELALRKLRIDENGFEMDDISAGYKIINIEMNIEQRA